MIYAIFINDNNEQHDGYNCLLVTRTWVLLGFWWVHFTLHENLGSPRFLVGLSYSSREVHASSPFPNLLNSVVDISIHCLCVHLSQ
jgi:hypothetical protein